MIKKEAIERWFDDKYPNLIGSVRLVTGELKPLDEIMHDCITELSQDKWDLLDDYHNELLAATKSIFHPHFEGVKGVFESRNNRPVLPNDK